VVTPSAHPHLDVRWLNETGHSGLLIAVLGAVGEHDRGALNRMRHSAANSMALVLDVAAWGRGARTPGPPASAWLGAHGWRTVDAGPGDPVAAVWQELALAAASTNVAAARTRAFPSGRQ
jgi:hypothetical protein